MGYFCGKVLIQNVRFYYSITCKLRNYLYNDYFGNLLFLQTLRYNCPLVKMSKFFFHGINSYYTFCCYITTIFTLLCCYNYLLCSYLQQLASYRYLIILWIFFLSHYDIIFTTFLTNKQHSILYFVVFLLLTRMITSTTRIQMIQRSR